MEDLSKYQIKTVFLNLLITSLGSIIFLAFLKLDTFLIIPVGCMPLLLYCYFLWDKLAKKNVISQDAIDSVYYFGFLITIEILAVCIFKTTADKANLNVKTVALQFGAGLLATGIALLGRMILLAWAGKLDTLEANDTIEEFSRSVNQASEIVKQATAESRLSINDMNDKIVESLDKCVTTTSDALKITVDEFKGFLSESFSDLKCLDDFRSSVESLGEDIKELGEGSSKITIQLKKLTSPLDGLANNAEKANIHIKDTGQNSEILASSLKEVSDTLSKIKDINNEVDKVKVALEILGSQPEMLNGFIASLNAAVKEVDALKDRIVSLKDQTELLPEQFNNLHTATDKATKGLGGVDEWTVRLSMSMGAATERLNQLGSIRGELQEAEKALGSIIKLSSVAEPLLTQIKDNLSTLASNEDAHELERVLSNMIQQTTATEPLIIQIKDNLEVLANNSEINEIEKVLSSVIKQSTAAEPLMNQITDKLMSIANSKDLKYIERLLASVINQSLEAEPILRQVLDNLTGLSKKSVDITTGINDIVLQPRQNIDKNISEV